MQNIIEEKTCDILVLGGGGSGMVAAVRAAQQSGKYVIVLEKLPKTGGGAQFASCSRVFESNWQKKRGLDSHTADYIRCMQDAAYWQLDPELVANAIRGTGQFFDWFLELAPELDEEFSPGTYLFPTPASKEVEPVGPQAGHDATRSFGKMVMDTMLEQCEKYGVEVLTKHSAVDVEMKDGRIAAVIVQNLSGYVRIRCNACILATGSWIRNKEILEKICPEFLDAWIDTTPHMNPAYTGDGIRLAEKAGAFVDYDSFCLRMMGPLVMLRSTLLRAMVQSRYAITVNQNGKRYCSEPISHMETFEDGLVQLRQPHGVCYHLFDMNCIEAHSRLPYEPPKYGMMEMFSLPPFPTDPAEIQRQIDSAFISGSEKEIFRAETLEDLASRIGVPPENLKNTVDRYNSFCEEGMDWDYAKPQDALVPLNKGPYFAVRATVATDGAFGGVLVDGNMQAYNANKTGIVEGLYVTGDFASGRHINLGGNKRQILNDMSWAFSSGFLAGTNAAEYIKTQEQTCEK